MQNEKYSDATKPNRVHVLLVSLFSFILIFCCAVIIPNFIVDIILDSASAKVDDRVPETFAADIDLENGICKLKNNVPETFGGDIDLEGQQQRQEGRQQRQMKLETAGKIGMVISIVMSVLGMVIGLMRSNTGIIMCIGFALPFAINQASVLVTPDDYWYAHLFVHVFVGFVFIASGTLEKCLVWFNDHG